MASVRREPDDRPFGSCPICGDPGISREFRVGGQDLCSSGHTYLSSRAVPVAEGLADLPPMPAWTDPDREEE